MGRSFLFLGLAFFPTLLLQRSSGVQVQSDEGYTLNGAWQLWNGMKMYRDFRQFVGPGSSYSIDLLWHLIGAPSYLSAKLLALALSFSSLAALVLTLRRVGARGVCLSFSIAAWLLASSFYPLLNHNSFSSFAATWFLLLFLRVADKPDETAADGHRTLDYFLVGAAAGAVFLFLPTKGLLLAVAAAAFTWAVASKRRNFRPPLALAAGFVVVVAPLFLVWSPAILLREWLIVPLAGDYLRHTGTSAALVAAGVVLTGGMGWIAVRRGNRLLEALTLTQAALVVSIGHNLDLNHLAINAFPAIVFVALLAQGRLECRGGQERLSAGMAMTIIVAMLVALTLAAPAGRRFARASTLYVDLLGRGSKVLFSSRRVAETHAIYAGPFLPGVYFELAKKNPYFVSETIVCDGACQQRLIGQLSVTKPELAILNYEMVRHLGYDENSPVDVFLRERYTLCHGHYADGMIVRASDASWCP